MLVMLCKIYFNKLQQSKNLYLITNLLTMWILSTHVVNKQLDAKQYLGYSKIQKSWVWVNMVTILELHYTRLFLEVADKGNHLRMLIMSKWCLSTYLYIFSWPREIVSSYYRKIPLWVIVFDVKEWKKTKQRQFTKFIIFETAYLKTVSDWTLWWYACLCVSFFFV